MGLKSIFTFTLLAAAIDAGAQQPAPGKDTVLKGSTIEVIQAYKPQVKQVSKPQWVPQLPPTDTILPVLNYEVPQQSLYYTYSSLPLRPLALGKDSTPKPFPNYIKLGAGNLSTIFLDAGIGGISGKDYETAIHLHHLSQKGSLQYQQSALSGIEADASFHKMHNDWHTYVMAERNQYYYYGYDHSLSYNEDSLKQIYTTIRVGADVSNKDSSGQLFYHPAINASLYNAKFNTSEINIGFNIPLTFRLDSSFDAVAGLNGAITSYKTDAISTGNNFVEFLPGINIHSHGLSGHAFVGVALGKGNGLYILPDLLAEHTISGADMTASAGWQATLRQNTYEQLTTENPFIVNNYTVLQTRKDEIFVNLRGGRGNHLTYSGRLSWWNLNTLPTFINVQGDQQKFYIQYVNATALSFHAGARYQVASMWAAGLSGDFFKYSVNTATKEYVWGVPNTKIRADFIFMPATRFTLTAYLALLDGIYAQDQAGNTVKQNMATDLGCNAEYLFISRLSVFAEMDNILNQKYERWYHYPAYGLNAYGGIRLKF